METERASLSADKMITIETIKQTTENGRKFSNLHQFLTAVASIISVAVYAGNVHSVTTVSREEAEIYTYSFGYSFIIQWCVSREFSLSQRKKTEKRWVIESLTKNGLTKVIILIV